MEKKYNWLLTKSGTDSDGSEITYIKDKTINEIKQKILQIVNQYKKTLKKYDYGTETIEGIEERRNSKSKKTYSVYGYIVYLDGHLDIEAHRTDLILKNKTNDEKTKLSKILLEKIKENKENNPTTEYQTGYVEGYHDALVEILNKYNIKHKEIFYV